jgi:hypothetical protein
MGASIVVDPAATGADAATGAGAGTGAGAETGAGATLATGVKDAAAGAATPPLSSSTSTVYAVPSTVTLYFTLITTIPLSKIKFFEIFYFTNQ